MRLGTPERFDRELRAAAGLPELPAVLEQRPGLVTRLARHRRTQAARGLARELAPVWWVVRGFAAFTAVAQLLGDDWSFRYPVFTAALGHAVGWIVLLGTIAGSISLGRRGRETTRRWPRVLDVALVLVTLWLLLAMAGNPGSGQGPVVYVEPVPETSGLLLDGRPVGNVFPYDRDGRLLQDVRLYDDTGTPLDVRRGEGSPRRVVADASGARRFNSFPIRYFDAGTRVVRRPRAGALDEPPEPTVTAPLTVGRP